MNKQWLLLFCIIIMLSSLLHIPYLSKDLMGKHVWRQAQTQSTIDNFYEEDMNILNPRQNERFNSNGIFRMEFPLMQWMIAVSYKISGEHLMITRLWMLVIGFCTIGGMYKLLSSVFRNTILAMMGAWAFCWSPDFFYYTINPLPDNLALCFSVWGIALFFSWCNKQKNSFLLLSGLLLSLATLCKLPFVLYFTVPFAYFIKAIKTNGLTKEIISDALTTFVLVLLPFAWYVPVIARWEGNGIVQGVLNSKTGLLTIIDYVLYHLYSTLPELLLNYATVPFFTASIYFLLKRKAFTDRRFTMFAIWGLAVAAYFLFEINMIEKVHDYYLFPFYPLLFILVGYGVFHLYQHKRVGKYITLVLLIVLPVTSWLRMKNAWNENNPGFNKELLNYKKDLQKAVPDNALCVAGNDYTHNVFFYYIHKKGWNFDNDNYDAIKLNKAIQGGAKYLYSDSRKFDEDKNVIPLLDSLLMQRGSIKIYTLKQ